MTISTEERSETIAKRGARLSKALMANVVLLTMIAPLATDMYVPAFPIVGDDLQSSATEVQLTLTTFFVGMALGQLIGGPVSDQRDRETSRYVGAARGVPRCGHEIVAIQKRVRPPIVGRIGAMCSVDKGGDDGLVKDGGYCEGAGGFPLPEYLQARPYLHHERIQTLGRLVA